MSLTRASETKNPFTNIAKTTALYTPVIGDVLDAKNVVSDIGNKNYSNAALGLGLLFVPNAIERISKPIFKNVSRLLPDNFISNIKNKIMYPRTNSVREIIPARREGMDYMNK